jgi:signal transduction histidine kinase/DNA-binding NarL/FixJ family response regulator
MPQTDSRQSRPAQQIFRVRRHYNKWVGDETLEDYALRFTATASRRWSIDKVAKTALGATAFLALEAIAASVTLNYGFYNTLAAMLVVAAVIFITGFPISYYAAKYGLDIDLLTRGAGFGYLGSTITSLIYASFTFIFFAIEAAILASALDTLLGIPPAIGYVICAVAVIPIVTHGISAISRFQIGTQPIWLLLQITALAGVVWFEIDQVKDWTQYAPINIPNSGGFDLLLFGAAASVLFAMVAQIGEQVDYLRFMPEKNHENRKRWWFWLIMAGPGWIFIGLIKMLLGSFLAYLAFTRGASFEVATDPTYMYQTAFNYVTQSPSMAMVMAGLMVIISQLKINTTNAYAGSIAWSNFFSRLTHSHPGRVVWLVFNVGIALILMELGIYRALENVLGVFAIIAVSWLASLSADLLINKPLGLSPSYVEFKRAHLHDINPVGVGSMALASVAGIVCYLGLFGELLKNLAHFVSLGCCFIFVPLIAWLTKGRYYLARQSPELEPLLIAAQQDNPQSQSISLKCCICENQFEHPDMSYCPAYEGPICSLCCTLDSRCLDSCKQTVSMTDSIKSKLEVYLPSGLLNILNSRLMKFTYSMMISSALIAGLMALTYNQMKPASTSEAALLEQTLWTLFFITLIVSGVITWVFLLSKESGVVAQQESNRQTQRLLKEIDAHYETDQALQTAKEDAENANNAKSRYLSGISHELRTPLQSILGYAQLLSQKHDIPDHHQNALQIIKRSGDYLTDLIEGLLDISKIEANHLDIHRNKVQLPELISQLVELFKPQAQAKGIRFYCHLHNDLPKTVITDEKRLRQILINLLSNAIKYTEEGRVDFHIYYRNQVATFSIMDTGIGIRSENIERILAPFERVCSSDVPSVSGTGLGLTIASLLIEIMGGDLKIKSTWENGSCFTVALMLSPVDTPEQEISIPKLIKTYKGKRRTALIVDDHPVHRGLINDILSPLGFKVIEAQDGFACLEILENILPDILLIDISMPVMNGLELAKKIRQQRIHQPIIMISADAQEHHRQPTDNSPHDLYMVKPIKNQTLVDNIGTLLNLEWEYHNTPLPTPHQIIKQASENPSAVISPEVHRQSLRPILSNPLMRELLANAEIGYKKGVQVTLETILNDNLIEAGTFNYLYELATSMRFDKIVEAINIETHDSAPSSSRGHK